MDYGLEERYLMWLTVSGTRSFHNKPCHIFNPDPLNFGQEGGGGWVILENFQTGVGKIEILGGVGWYFQGAGSCSFSRIIPTFFNNLRNWRNEGVNFWLCSNFHTLSYHHCFNPLMSSITFLYPQKTSEKRR